MEPISPRALFAIALRHLGEKPKRVGPKRVVEFLQTSTSIPEDAQQFAECSRADLENARKAWGDALEVLEECGKHGITALALGDPHYPRRLEVLQENLTPFPSGYCPILYVKGQTKGLNAERAAAIIGTKTPSEFGRKKAREFGSALATEGVTIVSGLALGCDTEGHWGCIEARGCGVAVMAHGLDSVYPKANTDLAEALIAGGGCLISEYAPGTPPNKRWFWFRDRIQAGLSQLVIVIETPEWDGTMITADYAQKQEKTLACVTHPTGCADHLQIKGNSMLLKSGAAVGVSQPVDALRLLSKEKDVGNGNGGYAKSQLPIL